MRGVPQSGGDTPGGCRWYGWRSVPPREELASSGTGSERAQGRERSGCGSPPRARVPGCGFLSLKASALFPRAGPSAGMTHGAEVDHALLRAVHPQEGVHLAVEECGHRAAPESEPDDRQRKVLRDVTRIEVDIPVGPLAVIPLRAGEDGRPDEDGGA